MRPNFQQLHFSNHTIQLQSRLVYVGVGCSCVVVLFLPVGERKEKLFNFPVLRLPFSTPQKIVVVGLKARYSSKNALFFLKKKNFSFNPPFNMIYSEKKNLNKLYEFIFLKK